MGGCSYAHCSRKRKHRSPDDEEDDWVSFHRLPGNREMREKWKNSIRKYDIYVNDDYVICSKHFLPDSFYYDSKSYRRVKPDAIPTEFSYPSTVDRSTIRHDHNYSLQSYIKLKQNFDDLAEKYEVLKQRYKSMEDMCRGYERDIKYLSLTPSINDIKPFLSVEMGALLERMIKKKSTQTYPPELKKFAVTLHFFCSKAYNYVREKCLGQLPHVKTIQEWISEGEPGCYNEVLQPLERKIESFEDNAEMGNELRREYVENCEKGDRKSAVVVDMGVAEEEFKSETGVKVSVRKKTKLYNET